MKPVRRQGCPHFEGGTRRSLRRGAQKQHGHSVRSSISSTVGYVDLRGHLSQTLAPLLDILFIDAGPWGLSRFVSSFPYTARGVPVPCLQSPPFQAWAVVEQPSR